MSVGDAPTGSLCQPHLKNLPFVLRTPSYERMVITATNVMQKRKGLRAELFWQMHVRSFLN
jgi:hypothetical protein